MEHSWNLPTNKKTSARQSLAEDQLGGFPSTQPRQPWNRNNHNNNNNNNNNNNILGPSHPKPPQEKKKQQSGFLWGIWDTYILTLFVICSQSWCFWRHDKTTLAPKGLQDWEKTVSLKFIHFDWRKVFRGVATPNFMKFHHSKLEFPQEVIKQNKSTRNLRACDKSSAAFFRRSADGSCKHGNPDGGWKYWLPSYSL